MPETSKSSEKKSWARVLPPVTKGAGSRSHFKYNTPRFKIPRKLKGYPAKDRPRDFPTLTIHHPNRTLVIKIPRVQVADLYRAVGSVATAKKCARCQTFKPVGEFHLTGKRLQSYCKECFSLDISPESYAKGRGREKKPLVRHRENIVRGQDGLEGFVCKVCGNWKDLTQYYHTDTRLNPRCRKCISQQTERRRYLRLAREVFGETSEAFRYLEGQKQHNRFKAVCEVFGMVRYSRLSAEKKREVSGVLSGLPMGEGTGVGSEPFERAVETEVQENEKRHRRGSNVAMRPV
jgi:hypothetical protein